MPPAPSDDNDFPPVPERVSIGGSPIYRVECLLGMGGFGQVWSAKRMTTGRKGVPKPDEVAIKFEHESSTNIAPGQDPHEWAVYNAVAQCTGVPKTYYTGLCDGFYVVIMDRLGPSLWDLWASYQSGSRLLAPQYVANVALKALDILEELHLTGWVHGDVKPENMLVGAGKGPDAKLFLVDLGLASQWATPQLQPLPYDQQPDDFRGTVRYASIHAHLGRAPSRRDDLESLAYSLLFLLKGKLPWQNYEGERKGFYVAKTKMSFSTAKLFEGVPEPFKAFMDVVTTLSFTEEPPYAALAAIMAPLAGEGWPLNQPSVYPQHFLKNGKKVSVTELCRKRRRADNEDALLGLEENGRPNKKVRAGLHASQWITVFGDSPTKKQRYHHNVQSLRLEPHIQEAWKDGLQIQTVAAHGLNWVLVYEPSCKPSVHQVYHLSDKGEGMPKDVIEKKWKKGFFVTALAGNADGRALVVMSCCTPITYQCYKVSETFSYEWIKDKWEEGLFVTSVATFGVVDQDAYYSQSKAAVAVKWAVVMSKGVPFLKQSVELDFQYPSEGIHIRWEQGYRITCCGATAEQSAFVLSQAEDVSTTQETLRTGSFPSTHVKEKWGKEVYLLHICHGRTLA